MKEKLTYAYDSEANPGPRNWHEIMRGEVRFVVRARKEKEGLVCVEVIIPGNVSWSVISLHSTSGSGVARR